MKLAIVIVCYRVPDLTIDGLRSLAAEIGCLPGTGVEAVENPSASGGG